MPVYKPIYVENIQTYYGNELLNFKEKSVFDYLSILSLKLYEGIEMKKDFLFSEINNYHPDFLGASAVVLSEKNLDLKECQKTIAAEYGFSSWESVESLKEVLFDEKFEKAVQLTLNGNLAELKPLVSTYPYLIKANSKFGHRATLLHYCGNNGVEFWRQQVPSNLLHIIELLLDHGSDKKARMNVYGGKFTTFQLFTTSAHPKSLTTYQACSDLLEP